MGRQTNTLVVSMAVSYMYRHTAGSGVIKTGAVRSDNSGEYR